MLNIARSLNVLLTVLALAACGGGGGSGSGGGQGPVISNLRFSPTNAKATTSDVSVNGSIEFNSTVDLVSLRLTDSRGVDNTLALSGLEGVRSSTLTASAQISPGNPAGPYTFSVWVIDKNGNASNKLTGTVTLTRADLVASAGADMVVQTGKQIALDGGKSVNLNGTTTRYQWTLVDQPAGGQIDMSGTSTATPTLTPRVDGAYTIQLVTSDDGGSGTPSTIKVSAIPAGRFTIGSAKADVLAVQGQAISVTDLVVQSRWDYGRISSYVVFSGKTGLVESWNDYDGLLRTIVVPGGHTTGAAKISLTASIDDLILLQGTPINLTTNTDLGTAKWDYDKVGTTYVNVSLKSGLVTGWNNFGGVLKLQ